MSDPRLARSLDAYRRALDRLHEALAEPTADNPLAVDGTIQRFEFVFELAWKTLKRALAYEGVGAETPREVLREAYAARWLDDEAAWLGMLHDRSLTSHVYDSPPRSGGEEIARTIYERVRANFPTLERLHAVLRARHPS